MTDDKTEPLWLTDPWNYSSWDGHRFEEDEEACGSCRFWERFENKTSGECRRHAPQATAAFDEVRTIALIKQVELTYGDIISGLTDIEAAESLAEVTEVSRYSYWPQTENCQWCGEWKRAVRNRERPR